MKIFSRILFSYTRQCIAGKCSFSTTSLCHRGRQAVGVFTAEQAKLYDQGKLKIQQKPEVSKQHGFETDSERFELPQGVSYVRLSNEDKRFR